MTPVPRRRRLLSLATAATLTLGAAAGASLVAGPAQSADPAAPAADCATPFPVSELQEGAAVTGRTVTRGTTPTGFTGEVLGVLEDGIAPGVDMVMVDLDSEELDRVGGIWQGMSGSPVYAEDGRLIGAVAYGLSEGPSPIAGVTPFEQMDDYLGTTAPPRSVRLGDKDARTVAARTGMSRAEAARGFSELATPIGVSGLSPRRLAQLKAKGVRFVDKSAYVLGRAGGNAPGAETVVAGGNVAASAAYGDITLAGVGTATSVCGDRVVGFGHPMAYFGATTEGLHPASAIYVQPDSAGAPFKVANVAPPVGTVTDDRTTGITGTFGPLPASTLLESTATFGSRTKSLTTAVSVPEVTGAATFYQLISAQDAAVDGPAKGSELLSWEVTGTDGGTPFTLTYTDRFTSTDLTDEPPYSVATLMEELTALEGVTVTGVRTTADLTSDLRRHKLVRLEQRRGGTRGTWVTVDEDNPAVARAGKPAVFRVVLGGSAGTVTRQLAPIVMPRGARSQLALMTIAAGGGGDDFYDGPYDGEDTEQSVATIRAALAAQPRQDQVEVQLGSFDRLGFDDEDLGEGDGWFIAGRERAGRPVSFLRTQRTTPAGHVVAPYYDAFPVVID